MSLENCFPYRPLNQVDIDTLTEICGGAPVTEPDKLQGIFLHLAEPMLRDGLAKIMINIGAEACAETLDTNPLRGKQTFHRGALLYAAVLAECSPLSTVPCEPKVFSDIGSADGEEFMWAANERLHDESPTFCNFMRELSPALELFSPIDYRLATTGAGLLHIMTTESLKSEESDDFERQHPELFDLAPLFRAFDDQEG